MAKAKDWKELLTRRKSISALEDKLDHLLKEHKQIAATVHRQNQQIIKSLEEAQDTVFDISPSVYLITKQLNHCNYLHFETGNPQMIRALTAAGFQSSPSGHDAFEFKIDFAKADTYERFLAALEKLTGKRTPPAPPAPTKPRGR